MEIHAIIVAALLLSMNVLLIVILSTAKKSSDQIAVAITSSTKQILDGQQQIISKLNAVNDSVAAMNSSNDKGLQSVEAAIKESVKL